jgi:hypothetical protein
MYAPVYAPSLRQLQHDFVFIPPVHWGAGKDVLRRPG